MICEKCWGEAYMMMRETGKSQYSCYLLIARNKNVTGESCTRQEQAGSHWDEKTQRDTRYAEKQ